ncbi:helix-turn-helix domain-containing protein [Stenomitos frigidus]|uniref:Transcriptional regulator n=2 Tax=Stenomitos TaxID=1844270 RepID=A0A2T1EGN6_9CYAN|nr:transcriptional regulator [Stenomitos frigidus]PSB31874.1 transcriptional regulator [Stenomitos frigidus ULC18]
MTFMFNPKKYGELLSQYQPKLIRTEAENDEALAIVETLMHRPNRSLEENELFALLITLIEKFEQEHYLPGTASTPRSRLLFLMEQRQLQPADLSELLGSEDAIAAVMSGDREISTFQAKALGAFFHVDPGLFI